MEDFGGGWPTLGRAILEMQATKGPKKWVWTYYPGHCWDCPSFVISKILASFGASAPKEAADKIEKILGDEWRKKDIGDVLKKHFAGSWAMASTGEMVDAIAHEAAKWTDPHGHVVADRLAKEAALHGEKNQNVVTMRRSHGRKSIKKLINGKRMMKETYFFYDCWEPGKTHAFAASTTKDVLGDLRIGLADIPRMPTRMLKTFWRLVMNMPLKDKCPCGKHNQALTAMHVLTVCPTTHAVNLRKDVGLASLSSSLASSSATPAIFPRFAKEFKACYEKFHKFEEFFIASEIDEAKFFKAHKGQIGKALKISEDAIEWFVADATKAKDKGISLDGVRLDTDTSAGDVNPEALKKFFDDVVAPKLNEMIAESLSLNDAARGQEDGSLLPPSSNTPASVPSSSPRIPSENTHSINIPDDDYFKKLMNDDLPNPLASSSRLLPPDNSKRTSAMKDSDDEEMLGGKKLQKKDF